MTDLVVVGGGGHAKVVISLLKKIRAFRILGYTDLRDQGPLSGVDYLGSDEVLMGLVRGAERCSAVVGVGQIRLSAIRRQLYEKLMGMGFLLPAIVSPDAVLNSDVAVGSGTVIGDGVVINTGARIGIGSIVNTGCIIDHDCEVGDYVHVATGAVLSGGVKVGSGSMIGAGATVIQYRTIGENCLIGAGSVVVNDCLLPGSYFGVPARKVKD